MMKVYNYQGVEYKSEREVRQAIFKSERKAIPTCESAEAWAKFGVVYTEVEVQLTQEQLASQARAKRDMLLRKSDYYVMPDYPHSVGGLADVQNYRQALRDITKQEGFPKDVTWPIKPSVL